MASDPLSSTDRLCVHTITTKPLSLEDCARIYPQNGIHGITVWRQALEGREPAEAGRMLSEAGLSVVSLCRGGFFPGTSREARQKAIDDNLKALDEAAGVGAPQVVLVCGAVPGQPLPESRRQIADGIAACLDHAAAVGVKLSVEPLHPMYADDRSAINTLRQANDLCDELDSPLVGVAVDVYHLWWDPDLQAELIRCGQAGRIFAYHVCDWRTPTTDLLNDRGLMGEGCIPLREIREWVESSGFGDWIEVEVFSHRWWSSNQQEYLRKIREAYLQYV